MLAAVAVLLLGLADPSPDRALLVGLAQAVPAPTPTPAAQIPFAPTEPVAMFKTVCIGGQARLSRKWATVSGYAKVPAEAQAALGQPVMNVPNAVYQIGGGDQYLILPAPDSAMPFRMGCAVIWKGDGLAAAQKLIPAPPESLVVVTAKSVNGWTVLESMPAPKTAAPVGIR
jgi:hypothetical protein